MIQQELKKIDEGTYDALRDDDCCDVKCQVEETDEANFFWLFCKGKNNPFL